jgi:hypothetical protein
LTERDIGQEATDTVNNKDGRRIQPATNTKKKQINKINKGGFIIIELRINSIKDDKKQR